MQFLTYLAVSLIAYLGLVLGIILIRLAPEEQKPGLFYFSLLKKIVFMVLIAMMLFFYQINFFVTIAILVFFLLLVITRKINLEKNRLVYACFGILFFLASLKTTLYEVAAVLIFLYGVPAASLLYHKKENNYKAILLENVWYFVPIVILPFALPFLL